MVGTNIYSEFLNVKGSTSVQTLYSQKVKQKRILHVKQISVNLYTTLFGDYVTAKYISVGIEHGGVKQQVQLKDNNGTYGGGLNVNVDLFLSQGDRIFVTIEDTAATVTYEVLIQGIYLECA